MSDQATCSDMPNLERFAAEITQRCGSKFAKPMVDQKTRKKNLFCDAAIAKTENSERSIRPFGFESKIAENTFAVIVVLTLIMSVAALMAIPTAFVVPMLIVVLTRRAVIAASIDYRRFLFRPAIAM